MFFRNSLNGGRKLEYLPSRVRKFLIFFRTRDQMCPVMPTSLQQPPSETAATYTVAITFYSGTAAPNRESATTNINNVTSFVVDATSNIQSFYPIMDSHAKIAKMFLLFDRVRVTSNPHVLLNTFQQCSEWNDKVRRNAGRSEVFLEFSARGTKHSL